MVTTRVDLARIALALLFLAALLGTSIWILRPFLPAVIWAMTLVIPTWPIMLRVQAWMWNKRGLVVTVMTLLILMVFVGPLWAAIDMVVRYAGQFREWGETLASTDLPSPPTWVGQIPLLGNQAVRLWQEIIDVPFSESRMYDPATRSLAPSFSLPEADIPS